MLFQTKRRKTVISACLLACVFLISVVAPAAQRQALRAEETYSLVKEETFDTSAGSFVQSGGAVITHVPAAGEVSGYLAVSGRTNNWDGVDFPFADYGMEKGKTYRVTITGSLPADSEIPAGARIFLQAPSDDAYPWLAGAAPAADAPFSLEAEYSWEDEAFTKFRVQSNEEGKTLAFNIDSIKLELKETAAEGGSEEQAGGWTVVKEETFDTSAGSFVQSGGAVVTHVPAAGEVSGYLAVSGRTNNWDGVDFPFADYGMEKGKTYRVTITGSLPADSEIPAGAQIFLQAPSDDAYPWLAGAAPAADAPFSLEAEYTWEDEAFTKFRVQSNEEGKTLAFNIDTIKLEQKESGGGSEVSPTPSPTPGPVKEVHLKIDFEDGTAQGFVPRGGNEVLSVSAAENCSPGGRYSLHISGREQNWNGPSLNITDYLTAGGEYKISARLKSDTPGAVTYKLSTQIGEGGSASYNNLSSITAKPEDGWVLLESNYRYNTLGEGYVTIYLESDTVEAEFYIDDITIDTVESNPIEADMTLPSLKKVYQDQFLLGNAVALDEMSGEYLKQLKHHYNVLTCGNAMKPDGVYSSPGVFDFTAADQLVARILEEGFKLHGHVLVWHSQSPAWLWSDAGGALLSRAAALANMETHINTVVKHFGDKVISWDVVNEALDGSFADPENWRASLRKSEWRRAIGDDYLYLAFKMARKALEQNGLGHVKLYYNDYNDDQQNKAAAMYYMIKELNEKYAAETGSTRKLIDGVGMQAHYTINVNPANVRRSIERFRKLGIEISITELDVCTQTKNKKVAQELEKQALIYAELFKIFKENADVIARVTFWGINDANSWRKESYPQIFDEALKPKAAYYAVIDPETYLAEHDTGDQAPQREAKANYGTPQLGGSAADKIWEAQPALPIDQYQSAWNGATGEGKVLWDEQYLYLLIDVRDPQLDATAAAAYEQDSAEIFVNESGEEAFYYVDGVGQYRVNYLNAPSFNPEAYKEGFISFARVTTQGYEIEAAIPWKTIKPANGSTIGFDLQVNDAENGSRISVASWNDLSGQGYQDPSVFGRLELLKKEDTTPAVTTAAESENSGEATEATKPAAAETTATSVTPETTADTAGSSPKAPVSSVSSEQTEESGPTAKPQDTSKNADGQSGSAAPSSAPASPTPSEQAPDTAKTGQSAAAWAAAGLLWAAALVLLLLRRRNTGDK